MIPRLKRLRVFFVLLASSAAEATTCCVCEYLAVPLPGKNEEVERSIIDRARNDCATFVAKDTCQAFLTNPITNLPFEIMGADTRTKIQALRASTTPPCRKLNYQYFGHSGAHRAEPFIRSSLEVANQGDFESVLCSNNGCSTFKNVEALKEYVRKAGGSASAAKIQIIGNIDVISTLNEGTQAKVSVEIQGEKVDTQLPEVRHRLIGPKPLESRVKKPFDP